MKNLLVTGGAGFIGANFIRYLLEESDYTGRIVNVDKLTYAGNPASLSDIENSYSKRTRTSSKISHATRRAAEPSVTGAGACSFTSRFKKP